MLVGKENLIAFLNQAKPIAVRVKLASAQNQASIIPDIERDTFADCMNEFSQYLHLLAPNRYMLYYVVNKEDGKSIAWNHALRMGFDIVQGNGQPATFQQYPAAIGNPYSGDRMYTKQDVAEEVAKEVRLVKLELEREYDKKEFARQLKEAKEDSSGGAVGKALEIFGPMIAQKMGQPAAAPGAIAGDATGQYAAPANVGAPTDEQQVRFDAITDKWLHDLCGGNIDLLNTRMEKIHRAVTNPDGVKVMGMKIDLLTIVDELP